MASYDSIDTKHLHNYFNSICNSYKTNEYASFFTTHFLRKHLVNKIPNFENKLVLDIMSGRGENIKFIKNENDATEVITVDFSNKMNKIAKQNLKKFNLTQIEDDFFKVDYLSKSFDVIFCSFGIKTIDANNLNLFSEKISNLLKPKGEILLLEMVKPKNNNFSKLIKFYLEKCVPKIFGKQFKPLFSFIEKHKNMNSIKRNLKNNGLSIIEHKRFFDLFEIIHAKKIEI